MHYNSTYIAFLSWLWSYPLPAWIHVVETARVWSYKARRRILSNTDRELHIQLR